ncbi:MAG: hypothetical protein OJJ21_15735 [Ferrovibrio sp.]|uniref:hypothetical protein n=1 Tax=Ferrovibrio sp. TaxID=1917215 RepID=UPI00262B15BF|nr:hypothetical protein [Ferrovibrio sp.]MCW0235052.1 hypothetical protein [Ferrovibrio sp.]
MTAEPIFIPSDHALVRVDRIPLPTARLNDGKFSFAETLWCRDSAAGAALSFTADMRRLFSPDPAHVIDTTPQNVMAWRIIDFDHHPFVLDGEDASNLCLGAIRQAPARIAAEQTYAAVVAEKLPACFQVSMSVRVYQRAMFPFFEKDGSVSHVVTLIRPLTPGVALAAVSH